MTEKIFTAQHVCSPCSPCAKGDFYDSLHVALTFRSGCAIIRKTHAYLVKKGAFTVKIILAGCGKVGSTLTEQLSSEGYDLTVIDNDPAVLDSIIETYDVITVSGNCACMDTLSEADAQGADVLIATTGSDEVNLLCCATAHKLNPQLRTIARIRNPEYTEQIHRMRDVFSLSLVFNPEKQAAVEIERLLKYPGFLKRDTFGKGRMEIVELKVDAQSKLCGAALCALDGIVKCHVLICAVLRDGQAIIPDGTFVLQDGDRIFVTAPTEDLTTLLKSLGLAQHKVRSVMIVGGGKISYYLAEQLEEQGIDVKIIERDEARCRELSAALPRTTVILGDAGQQTLLEDEGLSNCDALVSLTGIDELNILTSLYADAQSVPSIITKLARVNDTRVIGALPIGSIISPRKLCCTTVVRYVRALYQQAGAAIAIHTIADGLAEAIEFRADAHTRHCGEPLKQLTLKPNIRLAGIIHAGKTEIAGGDSVYLEGDTVVVVSAREDVILDLNDIFTDGVRMERR